jgi:hypothetical protein
MKPMLHHSWNRDWIFAVGLFIVTLSAYQPAWNGKPIWDDDRHIRFGPFYSGNDVKIRYCNLTDVAPCRILVETREDKLEKRCNSIDSLFCGGNCLRFVYRLGGTRV